MAKSRVQKRRVDLLEKEDLIRKELDRFREETAPDSDDLPLEIVRLLDFIHEHLFDSRLTVGLAKSRCRIHNNNITTRFRQALGLNIREYIEAHRLKAAARLLRYREIEAFLIAMAIGYDNQETFCRAFRRYFDCSPLVYRDGSSDRQRENGGAGGFLPA